MRRGQNADSGNDPDLGWTKQELLEASGLSAKTFDALRKAARVNGPSHGGLTWVFSIEDLVTLVGRAQSGTFSERGGPAATAWKALLAEKGVQVIDKDPKVRRF